MPQNILGLVKLFVQLCQLHGDDCNLMNSLMIPLMMIKSVIKFYVNYMYAIEYPCCYTVLLER